ncbi:uncharacterized protein B0H18DRAFT_445308 [Fomitopsis serialis]|uniref:uncharacterized protein n=1 Tax=Fomitopsis serialis TaxID=139415 RepID=UPI002008796E|nr:uncharacterized protein B0H18DRAFT_445308 [Neoantrodia serialis]KAH9924060.1 hypothetical protein B0H18DRAFT_445308 [Neoantrodia serialis]
MLAHRPRSDVTVLRDGNVSDHQSSRLSPVDDMPRAMRNLYYAVHILRRRHFDLLFKQCWASRVKQWLATTRELRLTEGRPTGDDNGRNTCFLHALPLALGCAMPRVQLLTISALCGYVHMSFFPALSRFSSVESLDLAWCSLNRSQLQQIILSFPLLTSLTLNEIRITSHHPASSVVVTAFRPPSDIHLRHLRVCAHYNLRFFDWIAQSGLCISLEHLSISVREDLPRESMNALLKTAGSSLTRLLTHESYGDLVHNTALQSLYLRFLLRKGFGPTRL